MCIFFIQTCWLVSRIYKKKKDKSIIKLECVPKPDHIAKILILSQVCSLSRRWSCASCVSSSRVIMAMYGEMGIQREWIRSHQSPAGWEHPDQPDRQDLRYNFYVHQHWETPKQTSAISTWFKNKWFGVLTSIWSLNPTLNVSIGIWFHSSHQGCPILFAKRRCGCRFSFQSRRSHTHLMS